MNSLLGQLSVPNSVGFLDTYIFKYSHFHPKSKNSSLILHLLLAINLLTIFIRKLEISTYVLKIR